MAETIFSKILRGKIPCHRVYEDKYVLAFLDINPLSEGHTLVIPKQAVAHLDELDEAHAAAIGKALPIVARAVSKATGVREYNILQNNGSAAHQAVFHVHFHIIPKPSAEKGLEIVWRTGSLDQARGGEICSAIKAEIPAA